MPEKHKIAFISSLGFGGATTFVCNLAGELARRHLPVLVVSPEIENPFASDFKKAGVAVILHDQRRMIFEDRMQSMLRALAEFRPTVVIACLGGTTYEVMRYIPQGIYRMGIVQCDHAIFYDAISPYAEFLDAVVGISRRITKQLDAMRVFQNVARLCLLHGVGMPPAPVVRGGSERPLRILYLGRIMNPQKRANLFPKILADLRAAGIPFEWTIAGEGEERANLEKQMSSTPTQQVRFIGAIPNAQVPALLEQQDIFLLASDSEGLPISLLEAMAHGLVPVVSDLESGIRDVVDASNGILVPVNAVADYAKAILHLHDHRDELAAKSAASRARVENDFSVSAMADRWLAALPAPSPTSSDWPARWKIKAPLMAKIPLYFSPPLRVLRRMTAKLRG